VVKGLILILPPPFPPTFFCLLTPLRFQLCTRPRPHHVKLDKVYLGFRTRPNPPTRWPPPAPQRCTLEHPHGIAVTAPPLRHPPPPAPPPPTTPPTPPCLYFLRCDVFTDKRVLPHLIFFLAQSCLPPGVVRKVFERTLPSFCDVVFFRPPMPPQRTKGG